MNLGHTFCNMVKRIVISVKVSLLSVINSCIIGIMKKTEFWDFLLHINCFLLISVMIITNIVITIIKPELSDFF